MISLLTNVEVLGFTLSTLGKVFISYTAIMVHHRFRKEHKIDERLFIVMRRENVVGVFGLILIVVGYFLELSVKI